MIKNRWNPKDIKGLGWWDVNDCLPNPEEVVIVCNINDPMISVAVHSYLKKEWCSICEHLDISGGVTHWMPLPLIPDRRV